MYVLGVRSILGWFLGLRVSLGSTKRDEKFEIFAGLLVVKGAPKILVTLGTSTPRKPLLK